MASRNLSTLQDVIVAVNQINSVLDKINTKDLDLHGRRVTGAGPSQGLTDYVIQKELLAGLAAISLALAVFIKKVTDAITIDSGTVTIQPGKLQILDDDGNVYKLTPVNFATLGPGDIVVGAKKL